MTHELRFLERLRRGVASLLHAPLSLVGLYAERETPREQYAFTLREPTPIVEAQLHRLGFVRNLVSSLTYRTYETPPETTVASWVHYPDGALASDRQLHLALYTGTDRATTDVYGTGSRRGSATRSDTTARTTSTPRRASSGRGRCSRTRESSTQLCPRSSASAATRPPSRDRR